MRAPLPRRAAYTAQTTKMVQWGRASVKRGRVRAVRGPPA